MPVFCRVGFHSLEYGLSILDNTCTFIHHDIRIIDQRAVVPFSIFIISHTTLVCLDIAKSDIFPVKNLFLHCVSSIPLLHAGQQLFTLNIIIPPLKKIKSALGFFRRPPFSYALAQLDSAAPQLHLAVWRPPFSSAHASSIPPLRSSISLFGVRHMEQHPGTAFCKYTCKTVPGCCSA